MKHGYQATIFDGVGPASLTIAQIHVSALCNNHNVECEEVEAGVFLVSLPDLCAQFVENGQRLEFTLGDVTLMVEGVR